MDKIQRRLDEMLEAALNKKPIPKKETVLSKILNGRPITSMTIDTLLSSLFPQKEKLPDNVIPFKKPSS